MPYVNRPGRLLVKLCAWVGVLIFAGAFAVLIGSSLAQEVGWAPSLDRHLGSAVAGGGVLAITLAASLGVVAQMIGRNPVPPPIDEGRQ